MSELRDAISILPAKDLDKLNQGATAEECAEALSDYAIKIEAERDALKKMLDIAWDAVQEAGYEDLAHELRAFMEGQG